MGIRGCTALSSASLHSGLMEGELGNVSAGPADDGEVLRRPVAHLLALDSLSDLFQRVNTVMTPGYRAIESSCVLRAIVSRQDVA